MLRDAVSARGTAFTRTRHSQRASSLATFDHRHASPQSKRPAAVRRAPDVLHRRTGVGVPPAGRSGRSQAPAATCPSTPTTSRIAAGRRSASSTSASSASGAPSDDWSALIEDHVRLVTTPARDLSELSQHELEAGLYLRLAEAASVPDPDAVAYARSSYPASWRCSRSTCRTPWPRRPAKRSSRAARSASSSTAHARTSSALLESDGVRAEQVGDASRGRYTAVTGDSVFTASLALLLAETIERFSGEDDWGRGVLVAVPCRHQLLYRPINGPDAEEALHHMLEARCPRLRRRGGAAEPRRLLGAQPAVDSGDVLAGRQAPHPPKHGRARTR